MACGDPGTQSMLVANKCLCIVGYEFCNNDPEDFTCCEIMMDSDGSNGCGAPGSNNHLEGDDVCVCDAGFEWCNPGDLQDLTCCEPEMGESTSATSA